MKIKYVVENELHKQKQYVECLEKLLEYPDMEEGLHEELKALESSRNRGGMGTGGQSIYDIRFECFLEIQKKLLYSCAIRVTSIIGSNSK
jgi:hypothetical protein